MPHRASLPLLRSVAVAAPMLLSLVLSSGCASADAGSAAAAAPSDGSGAAPAALGPGIHAGWMALKSPTKTGQVTELTLVSEGSREGKLIASGKARMEGGKVVSDATAADLAATFDRAGFARYAVKVNPREGPAGALGVVWINRGDGYESLFLLPGARQNSATADLPDVYQALKLLVFQVHQTTPGSMVTTGDGWSGEDLLRQKPGEIGK